MRTFSGVLLCCCLGAILALLIASLPTFPYNGFSHQICGYNNATKHEDCATYSTALFVLIEIGKTLNQYSAAISALATVAVGTFTWQLKRSTDRLWNAAERQADLTRDAMIAGERAFIFATGIMPLWDTPTDPANPIYNWRFRPNWHNSGDTPTKNMTMHTECVLRDSVLPTDFNFDYPTTEIGTALIAPKITGQGGLAPRMPAPAITPNDIKETQRGKKFLYFWGWARYFDVFPGTPQHITRFCWLVIAIGDPDSFHPEQKPTDADALQFQYINHFTGNCADEECDS